MEKNHILYLSRVFEGNIEKSEEVDGYLQEQIKNLNDLINLLLTEPLAFRKYKTELSLSMLYSLEDSDLKLLGKKIYQRIRKL
ncbi:hypothetical protein A2483_02310 [Candidatus Peregrinibacteria bacterium RIFOXYC2_FULL_33_13]|nr:MAG: hypothetical protein UR27_C0021G0004 [Candidatus Peregrinibacteria bacterium GW2011_GWA2_33_10]KKP41012.1 MAG: hypothetical protein UR30_C0002G0046 [Candidatus Peregrinibacteria bacterium GW2011_GWC2_33_13]OGJ54252.1 MAG: hypothetical protein A2483_02310 [Candidatus Peregrinibacteria bacterium RIFOXYC2_FULL_33_13]